MIIMMIFNMLTSCFSQNFISLFSGLFHDETDLRVRYIANPLSLRFIPGCVACTSVNLMHHSSD
jgi:hypothetical protein